MLTVLQSVAPVFLLASLGLAWVRLGWDYPVPFVTQLAMRVGLPCLIFNTLIETEIDPAALTAVAAATAVGYGALTVVLWLFVRLARLEVRTFLAPLIFGNTGNLGLPLVLFAYGEVGLGYGIVVFAVMVVFGFTYGVWLVAGQGAGVQVLRDPMVLASVLGVVFLWQGWGLPEWLGRSVALAGQLGIPLMLITLGVAVAQLSPGRIGQAVWLSLVKVALSAAAAFAVAGLFELDPVARAVLILQMLTPVAVTSYLLAETYRADSQAVAGLVVISTALSVAILPLVLALLASTGA